MGSKEEAGKRREETQLAISTERLPGKILIREWYGTVQQGGQNG